MEASGVPGLRALMSSTPVPVRRMSQTERLTEQFYAWERRGRGWSVWSEPVDLEPPFAQLEFWEPRARESNADDGQHPTALSRLLDRLQFRSVEQEPAEHAPEPEPEPELDAGHVERRELCVALPPDLDASVALVEQFLTTLPRLGHPVSFEIVGASERVWLQFSASIDEFAVLEGQFAAHFPWCGRLPTGPQQIRAHEDEINHTLVVEFGLSEEFMLPLRVPARFEPDPLAALYGVLSALEPGEEATLQVLFQPVRAPWSSAVRQAVLAGDGSPFFLDAAELTRRAQEKIASPLFAVVCRVAVSARDEEKAHLVARSIGWAFKSLDDPLGNRLIPLSNEDYPDSAHRGDFHDRRSRRRGMLLSSRELAALVHLPSSSVQCQRLARGSVRSRPAPPTIGAYPYVLGVNEHAGKSVEVSLSEEQRSRHVYVVGASGTGKSTLLLQLMLQDLQAGAGLALLDPHGDLVDEVLRRLPPERLEDVVLIDPSDAEFPIGFNILTAHSELERTLLASDLVAVFRRLSTSWGDQMTSVLANAILAILEHEQGGTLVDLRRFLIEREFRAEYLKGVRDSEVVYYWQKEFPLLAGKPQAPLLTRLDTFLRPKPIRYMVAQRESRLDLRRMMDEGKIVLARLAQGAIGEENAHLLGTLLVAKFQQLAMSRQEQAAGDRQPFYLYIDEFQNFVTPSMEAILSGARKYRLGLVLAHQDLRQIQSRSGEVLSSVLANPGTRICFRVGDQDARTLGEGFAHFDAAALQSLGVGQAIARVERAEYDFNLSTQALPRLDSGAGEAIRDEVIRLTRERFARPRAEVEATLQPSSIAPLVESPVTQSTPASALRRPVPRPETSAVEPSAPAMLLPVVAATPASSGGRGGPQHRYLQELICRWADANGWRSTLEEEVLGGLGRIDVVLRKGERSLACEIGVTTSSEHELQNIQKCLAAGFERVAFVSPQKKVLRELKSAASRTLESAHVERTSFCSPEEVFDLLDALEAATTASESTVRGYKVKVRAKADRASERASIVSGVIAKAMRRVGRG